MRKKRKEKKRKEKKRGRVTGQTERATKSHLYRLDTCYKRGLTTGTNA
jgi:hypothetical protein